MLSSITAMNTENWVALLAIIGVFFVAITMTLRHLYTEKVRQYQELTTAYRSQESEMNQRTQRLRATNNELYDEIAQHQRTETKLRQTQDYLYSIIDSMPSILIGVTIDGKITHWNSRAEELTGHAEQIAIGNSIQDIWPDNPVKIELINEAIQQKESRRIERIKYVDRSGTRYYDIRIYPLISNNKMQPQDAEAVLQIDDVSMHVLMETQAIQSEKMASLGTLAAGMAHEINNPLGAILQGLQNIERRTSPALEKNKQVAVESGTSMESVERYLRDRGIYKFLDSIRDAGERSARIVSNMLDFSHKSGRHIPVNLNQLARHCLELSESSLDCRGDGSPPINVITRFDETLPEVVCCPAEIQQVILNLIRNAVHAFMGYEINAPIITIETMRNDSFVILKVQDNGCGIPDEIKKHIFEPFFTTKAAGDGTGLGLSISYFIITNHHHGRIEVESTTGNGSIFSLHLPLNNEPAT